MGMTAEGVNREISTSLECAYLCTKHSECKPLGIPKTALLKLAKRLPRKVEQANHEEQQLFRGVTPSYTKSRPPWKEIAKGILPSLCHVVHQGSQIGYKEKYELLQNQKYLAKDCVPERNLNPLTRPADPFRNDYDYTYKTDLRP